MISDLSVSNWKPRALHAHLAALGLLAVFAGAACGQTTGAATGSANPFDNIRRAGEMCGREDPLNPGGPPQPPPSPQVEADLGCAVSPKEAQAWQSASDALFVDTRLAADYALYGLAGAVNLTPRELEIKAYLKPKRLVLFGNGSSDQDLYRACTTLKKSGFTRVHVVRGGVMLWHALELPVVGRPPPAVTLARLDPGPLLREANFEDNVALVVQAMAGTKPHFGFSVDIPALDVASIKAVIERRKRELKGAPLGSVVLVAGHEFRQDDWVQMQRQLAPVPLLMYTNGQELLDAHAAKMKAVWVAHAKGPKRPACGS